MRVREPELAHRANGRQRPVDMVPGVHGRRLAHRRRDHQLLTIPLKICDGLASTAGLDLGKGQRYDELWMPIFSRRVTSSSPSSVE